jgi:hypothetical protein
MAAFTNSQKAAMGFMNQEMGSNPSADQIAGMSQEINDYANQNAVNPRELRDALHTILPPSGGHPEYEHDAASGAVSDGTQQVYGENCMTETTEELLRRIVREQLMAEHVDGQPYAGSLEDLAKLHSRTWGHGSVVDDKDWKNSIKLGRQFTKGTAASPLRSPRRRLGEARIKNLIRKIVSHGV